MNAMSWLNSRIVKAALVAPLICFGLAAFAAEAPSVPLGYYSFKGKIEGRFEISSEIVDVSNSKGADRLSELRRQGYGCSNNTNRNKFRCDRMLATKELPKKLREQWQQEHEGVTVQFQVPSSDPELWHESEATRVWLVRGVVNYGEFYYPVYRLIDNGQGLRVNLENVETPSSPRIVLDLSEGYLTKMVRHQSSNKAETRWLTHIAEVHFEQ